MARNLILFQVINYDSFEAEEGNNLIMMGTLRNVVGRTSTSLEKSSYRLLQVPGQYKQV
jgi:hypothetical protein